MAFGYIVNEGGGTQWESNVPALIVPVLSRNCAVRRRFILGQLRRRNRFFFFEISAARGFRLPASLPACLPACLLAWLPASLLRKLAAILLFVGVRAIFSLSWLFLWSFSTFYFTACSLNFLLASLVLGCYFLYVPALLPTHLFFTRIALKFLFFKYLFFLFIID